MNKKNEKASAKKLLEGICDEIQEQLEDSLEKRKTARRLSAIRAHKGLSQAEVAKRMGCSQSRVSKLECSDDDRWSVQDFREYSKAIGYCVQFGVVPEDIKPTDEVKMLTWAIRKRMNTLTELAKVDDDIAGGVSGFFYELFLNFGHILSTAAEQIPPRPDGTKHFECTVVSGCENHNDPDVLELIGGDTAAL